MSAENNGFISSDELRAKIKFETNKQLDLLAQLEAESGFNFASLRRKLDREVSPMPHAKTADFIMSQLQMLLLLSKSPKFDVHSPEPLCAVMKSYDEANNPRRVLMVNLGLPVEVAIYNEKPVYKRHLLVRNWAAHNPADQRFIVGNVAYLSYEKSTRDKNSWNDYLIKADIPLYKRYRNKVLTDCHNHFPMPLEMATPSVGVIFQGARQAIEHINSAEEHVGRLFTGSGVSLKDYITYPFSRRMPTNLLYALAAYILNPEGTFESLENAQTGLVQRASHHPIHSLFPAAPTKIF